VRVIVPVTLRLVIVLVIVPMLIRTHHLMLVRPTIIRAAILGSILRAGQDWRQSGHCESR
jgi:hypothetical protein